MAKARTKRRRSYKKKTTLPLGIVVPMATTGVAAVSYAFDSNSSPQVTAMRMGDYLGSSMTGYSVVANDFKAWRLKNGLLPLGIGFGVHKVATKLGINRMIASAGIPFIRI